MRKTTNRIAALLLAGALLVGGPSLSYGKASAAAAKKVYEVTYTTDDLSTPMSWVQSGYYNNPQYKETRFEDYNTGNPIPPGGAHETAFYMTYRDDGLYMFFQSTEPGVDANGNPLESWLEFYVATGEGDIPYHQMIVPTSGSPIEYYEWQSEYRENRPLEGQVRVDSKPIPGGWGTVVVIPWEAVYDTLPLDGGNWQFNLIRWSPVDGESWGGQVHQTGKFNLLHFQAPSGEQRTAIQKYILANAWSTFQTTSASLTDYWFNNPATMDKKFYNKYVLPLIVKGNAQAQQISRLDSLNADETNALYEHVLQWKELRYDVDDARLKYVRSALLDQHPDHTSPVTEAAVNGTQGTGEWYVSDAVVTLGATDDDSGVAGTEYALTVVQSANGQQSTDGFVPYTAPITLNEGVYQLQYRSTDEAGNIEDVKSLEVKIDSTAPGFALSANGSAIADGAELADGQPVTLDVQPTDSLSGVASQSVIVDGAAYTTGTALDWAGKLGTHTIQVAVTDQAGNTTQAEIHVTVKTGAASLQQLLDRFAAAGDLSDSLKAKLADDLANAADQAAKGNYNAAANVMRNFFTKLDNPKKDETVSAGAKETLTTDANALVQEWSGMPNHVDVE